MNAPVPSRAAYLDRLCDFLPTREAARILEEVDGLIGDRMEAVLAETDVSADEAERQAVAALGPADVLAGRLVNVSISVDLATRRQYVRMLAILFAVHLVLSIVLTVAGGRGPTIPGLLGPLPTSGTTAIISSVLAILLMDVGVLFLAYALLGRGKAPSLLPEVQLRTAVSRRDAALSLVLLALVALILHPLRDQVFAVREGDQLVGFLSPDLLHILPVVDVALAFFALAQVILLVRGEHATAVAADALGSFVLAGALVLAVTQNELVCFSEQALGKGTANLLEDLVTRVFLLLFVLGALFLTIRFVKRALRFRQMLG